MDRKERARRVVRRARRRRVRVRRIVRREERAWRGGPWGDLEVRSVEVEGHGWGGVVGRVCRWMDGRMRVCCFLSGRPGCGSEMSSGFLSAG